MRTATEIIFWVTAGLVIWTQAGYGLALWLVAKMLAVAGIVEPGARGRQANRRQRAGGVQASPGPAPSVSLIVAAHDEEAVIASKVGNALALHYPRAPMELIVACDGCTDATAQAARDAGADLVLELPRGGKIRAQNAAVARSSSEIVAFSDANSLWERDALTRLVDAFEDPRVGYACGQVRFHQAASGRRASNQEGAYWRYEMAIRSLESRLSSITAGNGAIYATRRSAYILVDPVMGHDLSLPFNMAKRGLRATYVPDAIASEKMVPSIEGESARKRRMMAHTWAIVIRGGMLSPRGYTPTYFLMIISHRLLRYMTPFLHAIALLANVAAVALGAGPLYLATLAFQVAFLALAALGVAVPIRVPLLARYYVSTTAALARGLWDWLREGVTATWDAAEGTR